jgi:hypothetical protein
MAALGSTTAERQHMNKAYSHNDHHWGIIITIKRRYHVKHLYYRSDRTCFNFFTSSVLGPNILLSTYSQTSSPYVPPSMFATKVTPTQKNWPNYRSVYLNLYTLYNSCIIFLDSKPNDNKHSLTSILIQS